MTNHHVGADCLQKLSTDRQGPARRPAFTPARRDEELKCVDLELNVLMSIEDVTERVNAAVKPGMDAGGGPAGPPRRDATRSKRNRSTRPACAATWSRSTRAGSINLYRYKKYTDVRLVFAPEKDIAFFGGDPDNFEYPALRPRHLLLPRLRRRQAGQAAASLELEQGRRDRRRADLRGRPSGPHRPAEHGGPPGIPARSRVSRTRSTSIRRREVHAANLQRARAGKRPPRQDELFGYQNCRKARLGGLAGLQDPAIMDAKRKAEAGAARRPCDNDPQAARRPRRLGPGRRRP